jgi:CHRD domain-containing protein
MSAATWVDRSGKGSSLRFKLGIVSVLAGALSAVVGSTAAGASSASYVVKASLDTGSVVPAVRDASGATATLSAKLTLAGKKSSFVWTIAFRHLSGAPKQATIYFGKSGKVGSIALPLCVKCQVPSAHGAYIGPYVALPVFVKAILHRGAYVEVAKKENPKGEVRGQMITSSP